MRKSALLAIFGLSAGMMSTYGQGFVDFSSYLANGGYGALTSYIFSKTGPVGIGYTAYLYCAFGAVSDPVNDSSFVSIESPISGAFKLVPGSATAYDNSGSAIGEAGLGYFDGPVVTIPGYTGGPITFEILAISDNGVHDGRSGSFTMDSIPTSPLLPPSYFGDNGQPMPDFYVAGEPVPGPEPATSAIAAVGGLIAFITFYRRKPKPQNCFP